MVTTPQIKISFEETKKDLAEIKNFVFGILKKENPNAYNLLRENKYSEENQK